MAQNSHPSEIFRGSIVRCCSSFISPLFTHSCQAVFSATLRATWSSHLLLLHGAAAPLTLPVALQGRLGDTTHAHVVHPNSHIHVHRVVPCTQSNIQEQMNQLKITRGTVMLCLVSRASHALPSVTVPWKVLSQCACRS